MVIKNKTILVLEDELSLRGAIKTKLELEGFDMVAVDSADRALEFLSDGLKIDAVWLDHYIIGKKSGLDFATKLRQNKLWKNVPIFVVSNTVSPDKIQAYHDLGVHGFYTKVNFRLDQIIEDIEKVFETIKPAVRRVRT